MRAAARMRRPRRSRGAAIVPPGPRAAAGAGRGGARRGRKRTSRRIGLTSSRKGRGVEAGTERSSPRARRGRTAAAESRNDGGEATLRRGLGGTRRRRERGQLQGRGRGETRLSASQVAVSLRAGARRGGGSAGCGRGTLWDRRPTCRPLVVRERGRNASPRSAASAAHGSAAHAVLGEGTAPASGLSLLARRSPLRLVPVCAVDAAALLSSLSAIADELEAGRGDRSRTSPQLASLRSGPKRSCRSGPSSSGVILSRLRSRHGSHSQEYPRRSPLAGAGRRRREAVSRPTRSASRPAPSSSVSRGSRHPRPGARRRPAPAVSSPPRRAWNVPRIRRGSREPRLVRPRARRLADEDFRGQRRWHCAGGRRRDDPGRDDAHAVTTTAVMRQCFGVLHAHGARVQHGRGEHALGIWRLARRRPRASPLSRASPLFLDAARGAVRGGRRARGRRMGVGRRCRPRRGGRRDASPPRPGSG